MLLFLLLMVVVFAPNIITNTNDYHHYHRHLRRHKLWTGHLKSDASLIICYIWFCFVQSSSVLVG